MSVEAFSVDFERSNYHAPILDEGRKDEIYHSREQEITANIMRYIGEYRLGVKFDEFYYHEELDQQGKTFLGTKEGPLRDVYRKAIFNREEKGLSVKREVAECMGFEILEEELLKRPTGSMAVWVSPPGNVIDGYGGYSFTFLAQSEDDGDKKKIRMIPYRNEMTIYQHNRYLSDITGETVSFENDTQFLARPFFIEQSDGIKSVDDLLERIGEEEKFDNSWYEDFAQKAWPLIQGFVYLVKMNASIEELQVAKYAIENFAIAYREDKNRSLNANVIISDDLNYESMVPISQYMKEWGESAPPSVNGSCGLAGPTIEQGAATTPMEMQNLYGVLQKDKYGERTFNCPTCKKENVRPYNKLLPRCQHCNSTSVAC